MSLDTLTLADTLSKKPEAEATKEVVAPYVRLEKDEDYIAVEEKVRLFAKAFQEFKAVESWGHKVGAENVAGDDLIEYFTHMNILESKLGIAKMNLDKTKSDLFLNKKPVAKEELKPLEND